MPVNLGERSKLSTGSSSNDFKYDWEKSEAKNKATKYKVLTGILTIGSVLALSYFGVHALGFAGVQSFAGSQVIGFSASAIGSTIGSYLLLLKANEWEKGEISDLDKLLIGSLGLLGAGAIGASALGTLGVIPGGALLSPVLGFIVPFGAISAVRALDDPKAGARNEEEKIIQQEQRATLIRCRLNEQQKLLEAQTEQKIAEASQKTAEASQKTAEASQKTAEASQKTAEAELRTKEAKDEIRSRFNKRQAPQTTRKRASAAVPVAGLFRRKTPNAHIKNPNETF